MLQIYNHVFLVVVCPYFAISNYKGTFLSIFSSTLSNQLLLWNRRLCGSSWVLTHIYNFSLINPFFSLFIIWSILHIIIVEVWHLFGMLFLNLWWTNILKWNITVKNSWYSCFFKDELHPSSIANSLINSLPYIK